MLANSSGTWLSSAPYSFGFTLVVEELIEFVLTCKSDGIGLWSQVVSLGDEGVS